MLKPSGILEHRCGTAIAILFRVATVVQCPIRPSVSQIMTATRICILDYLLFELLASIVARFVL
jgi:hypothetical protein